MGFLKVIFAILITKKVMGLIVSLAIALVLFYTFTDVGFMSNVFDSTFSWVEKNITSIVTWALSAVEMVLGKFKQNGI